MKTLYELANCSLQSPEIVNVLVPGDEHSPLHRLRQIVYSKEAKSDLNAMIEIYGCKNYAAFSKLKSRLKEIFIQAIVSRNINFDSGDSTVNEKFKLFRQTLAINLLLFMKDYNLSIELAEKGIKRSIKYHYTENVILLSKFLVAHFGSREFNKYKYQKYLSIQRSYLRIQDLELKAENYYLDLQRMHLQSLAVPSELTKERAKKYVKELDAITDINTFSFFINRYKVKAAFFEYQKDFDSLLKLSENTQQEFTKLTWKSNSFLFNLNVRRSWALIQAGRNDEAISNGLKILNKTQNGSLGWYFLAHYVLKAYLYKGDYKRSIDLIVLMIENSQFKKIGEHYRELFFTTLGYIHLIVDSGTLGNPNKLRDKLPEFKLYKFLNAVPVFSKDKRGINVSILLMHIAFLLQRKDYDVIIDRVDSLNHYAYRHLRKDETFRSNCMIKMVIQMTKAGFNPIRTKRYTEDLLRQLKQVKLAGSGENIETEIIPYEILWQIMLKSL